MPGPRFYPFNADEAETVFEVELLERLLRRPPARGADPREVILDGLRTTATRKARAGVDLAHAYAEYVLEHVEADTPTGRWRMNRLVKRVGPALRRRGGLMAQGAA